MVGSLFRKYEKEGSLFDLLLPVPNCIENVSQEWLVDVKTVKIMHQIESYLHAHQCYLVE